MCEAEEYKASSPTMLPAHVVKVLAEARKKHHRIVLATGVFDIFHAEHRLFLEKAKAVGDILVVGLESDVRVRALKGSTRPIVAEFDRWKMVVAHPSVDTAFVLPEVFFEHEQFLSFIKTVRPHILAVSSHTNHLSSKRKIMRAVQGEVVIVHEHNNRVSTTLLVTS
jgi:D-beta-D-heptose 7-phosphate kinase/D-beta-D-heptose 1-phosphate adenosyltransferase